MKRAKIILDKLLHPPVGIIIFLPLAAFSGLIYIPRFRYLPVGNVHVL